MFKKEYQGGSHVEVFSAQGKEPMSHWGVTGVSSIKKNFDKDVKSYVFGLEGSTTSTKMQLPKDPKKHALGLIQKYLVLQIFVPKGQDFSIDLGVNDDGNNRHHLILSTAYRTTSSNPLHAKISLGMLLKAKWLNLVLDLGSMVRELWQPHSYKSLESLCLSGSCRLRRVFTMRTQAPDTTSTDEHFSLVGINSHRDIDSIPKQCQFMTDVPNDTQVINMSRVRHFEGVADSVAPLTGRPSSGHEADLSSSGGKQSSGQDAYHIAFGSKVAGTTQPRKSSAREGSGTNRPSRSSHGQSKSDATTESTNTPTLSSRPPKSSRQPEISSSTCTRRESRTSGRERKNSDPGANVEDPDITVDKDSLRTSHTWTDGADDKTNIPFVKPHPPKEPSSEHAHRRRPRVKSAGSAGKERTLSTSSTSGHGSREDNSQLVDPGYSSLANGHLHGRGGHGRVPPTSVVMATEEEERRILHEMHSQILDDRLESESDPSSQNASANRDTEDSISEIISTLKGQQLHDGHEASDEEDRRNDADKKNVFLFHSKPKQVQVRQRHRKAQHQKTSNRIRLRKNDEAQSTLIPRNDQYRMEDDFPVQNSSDEEPSVRTRLKHVVPSPRKNRKLKSPKPKSSVSSSHPSSVQDTADILQSLPPSGGGQTPGNSQSRCCINRKSLREITSEELEEHRSSLQKSQKKYNPEEYACTMTPLSDSFEERMLQALTKETLEGSSQSEDEKPSGNSSKFNYVANDSSDETVSTPRPAMFNRYGHNYAHEIEGAMLTQSNPRDWLYSPPIVMPGAAKVPTNNEITPKVPGSSLQPDTDDEKELELLYDPGMNYYFEPQTGKYYELVRYHGTED